MNNKSTLISIILILLASIYGAYYMKTNDLSIKDLLPKNDSVSEEKNDWQEWEKQKPHPQEDKKKEQKEEPKSEEMVIADSYEEALTKANTLNKEIFIFFTRDNCSWCDKMKEETLKDKKVLNSMKKYIFFECNVKKDIKLILKYKFIGTPAYVVINQEEEIVKKIETGYKPPEEFLNWLN